MPPSHNDLSNELRTRALSQSIHSLINAHRTERSLLPFEWDLSLYYLALSLAKAISKHRRHPSAHPFPRRKCIGIAYKYSFAATRHVDDAARLFARLERRFWRLDGFIFSAVAGYAKGDGVVVVNVVARGAAIPRTVCPLCDGDRHFSASGAAAVFGRLAVPPERRSGGSPADADAAAGAALLHAGGAGDAGGSEPRSGSSASGTSDGMSYSGSSGSASVFPGAYAGVREGGVVSGSPAWNAHAYGWAEPPPGWRYAYPWYACAPRPYG